MKNYDIVSIGEVLIDFQAAYDGGKLNMTGSMGGAPCNVLAQASRLGARCCFVGSVGNDIFGDFIKQEIERLGIDAVLQKHDTATTLAIVSIDRKGERSFDFVRSPGADSMLNTSDAVFEAVSSCRVLSYGSLAFSKSPAAETVFEVLSKAACKRAYDPNLRPAIWRDDARMKQFALEGMKYADILKIGDDEALFLTGCSDIGKAASVLSEKYNIPYVFITMGARGCRFLCNGESGSVPSYGVTAKDTTGAGDSFFGALLYRYITQGFDPRVEQSVAFACAAGALTASKKGTADAMPDKAEIIRLMTENR